MMKSLTVLISALMASLAVASFIQEEGYVGEFYHSEQKYDPEEAYQEVMYGVPEYESDLNYDNKEVSPDQDEDEEEDEDEDKAPQLDDLEIDEEPIIPQCDYQVRPGGYGELKFVSPDIQRFLDWKIFGRSYLANELGPMKGISYRLQTVAGKNILIKALSLTDQVVHFEFYLPVTGGEPRLKMMHYATHDTCLEPIY